MPPATTIATQEEAVRDIETEAAFCGWPIPSNCSRCDNGIPSHFYLPWGATDVKIAVCVRHAPDGVGRLADWYGRQAVGDALVVQRHIARQYKAIARADRPALKDRLTDRLYLALPAYRRRLALLTAPSLPEPPPEPPTRTGD